MSYYLMTNKEMTNRTCKRMFDAKSNYIMTCWYKTKYTKCNKEYLKNEIFFNENFVFFFIKSTYELDKLDIQMQKIYPTLK